MTYSFNLVDRKWIPCTRSDGGVAEFSLQECLLKAHELRGVQGDSPLETAALYRLLLAVLHSALKGPKNRAGWADLWEKGCWDPQPVNDYLDQWKSHFDLFDPVHPFYQIPDTRVKTKSIITLALDMASGNNGVLFDHHTEAEGEKISAPKAARTLIVAQSFGLAGLSGLEQKFTDGSWGRGVIFLVEGDNLFETLALNMLRYPDEQVIPSSSTDCPAWEKGDPHQPNRQVPEGYLDYLTWQNRRILLMPEGDPESPLIRSMTMAPGLRLSTTILDPMKLYRTGKTEGYLVTRFSEGRALWRDSASLFRLRNQTGNYPPKTFYWLAELANNEGCISPQQTYRFMALGMANNQAKVEFFQEEHFPLPFAYLENDFLVEQLSNALELSENTHFALKVAAQWMALLIVSPKADGKKWQEVDRISKDQAEKMVLHWNADLYFWRRLELPFLRFLEDLPHNPSALQTWNAAVRQAAWNALEHAADLAGTDAVALKAAVRARSMLGSSLKELFAEMNQAEPDVPTA